MMKINDVASFKKMLSDAFDEGVCDLCRTAAGDGVFCYTFFKALGTRSRNDPSQPNPAETSPDQGGEQRVQPQPSLR